MKITKNHILKNSRKFTTLKITKNRILKNNQKFTIIKISNIAPGQALKISSKKKTISPSITIFENV